MLHAGIQINMQILRGVVILHAERDLIIHAADRIHDCRNTVKVDDHIFIRLETHQPFDLALGLLDSAHRVGRIDLAACAARRVVAHGIARDVHDIDGLRIGVHRRNHKRISSRLIFIHSADHKGEHVVDARARVEQAVHIDLIAVFLVLDSGIIRLRRTDKDGSSCRHTGQQGDHNHCRNNDAVALLLFSKLFFDLFPFFPDRLRCGLRRMRPVCPLLGSCRSTICRCFAASFCAALAVFMSAAASEKFQTFSASSVHSSRQRTPCRIISLYAAMVSL